MTRATSSVVTVPKADRVDGQIRVTGECTKGGVDISLLRTVSEIRFSLSMRNRLACMYAEQYDIHARCIFYTVTHVRWAYVTLHDVHVRRAYVHGLLLLCLRPIFRGCHGRQTHSCQSSAWL